MLPFLSSLHVSFSLILVCGPTTGRDCSLLSSTQHTVSAHLVLGSGTNLGKEELFILALKNKARGSQDGGTGWKFSVCLASMKYSQTNTKPSYTPRKLIGGLTQQSAQPEPQNSAGTWHREVNWGREKCGRQGAAFACQERTETGLGVGWRIREKHSPQKQLERKWKSGNSRRD